MIKRTSLIRSVSVISLLFVIFLAGTKAAQAKVFEFSDYLGDGAECYMATIGDKHDYKGVTYICTAITEPRSRGRKNPDQDVYVYYKWKEFGPRLREIKRADVNLCVSVSGSSRNSGAAIVQRSCVDSDHAEWWAEVDIYNSAGLLINYHSGKCLSVASGSQRAGARLVQMSCRGSDHSMLWTGVKVGSVVCFENYHSGLALTMGEDRDSGRPLYQARYTGGKSQLWALLPLV